MDKYIKQSIEAQEVEVDDTSAVQTNASRRRFTRGAIIGGAVVFSLGNRAAWGQGNSDQDVCLSANTVASLDAYNRGQRASMSPTTAKAIEDYNKELAKLGTGGRTLQINDDKSQCIVK